MRRNESLERDLDEAWTAILPKCLLAAGFSSEADGALRRRDRLVRTWIRDGADQDIILAVIRRNRTGAARTFRYFDQAVRAELAKPRPAWRREYDRAAVEFDCGLRAEQPCKAEFRRRFGP